MKTFEELDCWKNPLTRGFINYFNEAKNAKAVRASELNCG